MDGQQQQRGLFVVAECPSLAPACGPGDDDGAEVRASLGVAAGVAPAYGCPGGYWARRPLRDPYGNVVGWSRPRFFCPQG